MEKYTILVFDWTDSYAASNVRVCAVLKWPMCHDEML